MPADRPAPSPLQPAPRRAPRAADDAAPGSAPRAPARRIANRPAPSAAARELIGNLPEGMLSSTAAGFPHVIEAIARDWAEPARMHATLDAFLFDARGDRRGFPPEVVFELAELRARYERWVGPRTAPAR